MATKIFVNLPVKDLKKSIDFFTALGYSFNPQFTDENATCMIISDNIFAMLLVHPFFESFTKKPVPDAKKTSEVILALSAENKGEVDSMLNKVKKAGGTVKPVSDQGWMYTGSFEDLDGHMWEIAYMDLSQFPQN